MSKNKTVKNDGSVEGFIHNVENDQRRNDTLNMLKVMQEITGSTPKMWGNAVVGFDTYHYKYESGREGDFFITGFSPRKQALTIYIIAGFERFDELMQKLGKYKTGKSCLYVKKLSDVDMEILRELIAESVNYMRAKYH